MSQERLNHLMMLNVHKEWLDSVDLKKVANEFCAVRDYRVWGAVCVKTNFFTPSHFLASICQKHTVLSV